MGNVAEIRSGLQDLVRSGVSAAVQREAEAMLAPGSEGLMSLLDAAVVEGIEVALAEVSESYATQVLGAARYARTSARAGQRSGHRSRRVVTPFGRIELRFVKTRSGAVVPPFAQDLGRFAREVMQLGRELWTRGLSTRTVAKVAEDALGGRASHTTVATWVQDAADEVLRWLNRPLRKDIAYLVLDGIYVSILRESARTEPILVAVGITESGEKEVLDVMPAPSESAESWSTLLARLRARGLDPRTLKLVITDGNDGGGASRRGRAAERASPALRGPQGQKRRGCVPETPQRQGAQGGERHLEGPEQGGGAEPSEGVPRGLPGEPPSARGHHRGRLRGHADLLRIRRDEVGDAEVDERAGARESRAEAEIPRGGRDEGRAGRGASRCPRGDEAERRLERHGGQGIQENTRAELRRAG